MSAHEPRHEAQRPEPAPPQADDWQVLIAAYLARRCDMGPIGVYEVLCKCAYDEVTRMRYLKLARETMP